MTKVTLSVPGRSLPSSLFSAGRTLRTRLAIYSVCRAPADKLTKTENTIQSLNCRPGGDYVNLTFALSFLFHELHARSMQFYKKLILHVQIEIDFLYPVNWTASKSFFKYKLFQQ